MAAIAHDVPATMKGLTAQEAEARLGQFGPNEPASTRHISLFREVLHAFMSPLVLILLIAAIVSAILGDVVDAGIIAGIVLISSAIDLIQSHRSQSAVEQLRQRVPRRRPPCATESGKKFGGARWCRETSSAFLPETWFLRMGALWPHVTSMCNRQR